MADSPEMDAFSQDQLETIVVLERLGGSLSLASVMSIFLAYGLVRQARNVQNTFIVFASVSNVGASIASIIGLDGLTRGRAAALCQTQSFLFEMFMQSDPWWSLAMAVNVLLVFYFGTRPESFQRWWCVYCAICYGGPFVIALVLLLVKSERRGPVYGDATIWCWVDNQWDSIRIYTYYLLIWICIVGSVVCYFLVGCLVFRSRDRLHSLSAMKPGGGSGGSGGERLPRHCDDSSLGDDAIYGTVTTEVEITSSSAAAVAAQYLSSISASPRRRARRGPASSWLDLDPVKRAYLRTSLLFALSVLVTWTPSSLNRIHSWLVGRSPYEFHVATAAVLPLQGLWNAVIFFTTSWGHVRSRLVCLWRVGAAPSREEAYYGECAAGAAECEREHEASRDGDGLELSRVTHSHVWGGSRSSSSNNNKRGS